MLYEVSYWVPSTHESGWHCQQRFICGSKREAELWAEEKLPLTTESDYGYRRNRRPFIEVIPVKRFISNLMHARGEPKEYRRCGPKTTYDQPVSIVYSVGELGWTP